MLVVKYGAFAQCTMQNVRLTLVLLLVAEEVQRVVVVVVLLEVE